MSDAPAYTRPQIALHWLTFIAVAVAWFTHEAMEETARAAWRAGEGPFPTVHTAAGMLALFLVIARLVIRFRRGAPEPVSEGLAGKAAEWGHRLIYLFLIVAPVAGFLTWFAGIRDAGDIHEIAAKGLMILVLGHAALALIHHYVMKDGTMRRMLRPPSAS